jgi:hypothetical protein
VDADLAQPGMAGFGITEAILAGQITVPIAAVFPVEKIRDAVTLQAGRHVHGKIVVTLWRDVRQVLVKELAS